MGSTLYADRGPPIRPVTGILPRADAGRESHIFFRSTGTAMHHRECAMTACVPIALALTLLVIDAEQPPRRAGADRPYAAAWDAGSPDRGQ